MNEYYTVGDVAIAFNVSQETVRRWIRSGKLKASKTSKRDGFKIMIDDIHDFVDEWHHGIYVESALILPTRKEVSISIERSKTAIMRHILNDPELQRRVELAITKTVEEYLNEIY